MNKENNSDYERESEDESEESESEFVCECSEYGECYCDGECECECEECDTVRNSVRKRSEWFDGFDKCGDSVYWCNESQYKYELEQLEKHKNRDIDIIRVFREICHYQHDLNNNGFCNIDDMYWDPDSDEFDEPDHKKWPALAKLVKYTKNPMDFSMKKWVKCIDSAFDEIVPEAYKIICT